MRYFIVNKQNKALSGFYPNDTIGSQLRFRKNDAYLFSSADEAYDFLQYIKREARDDQLPTVGNLRVSTSAIGFSKE